MNEIEELIIKSLKELLHLDCIKSTKGVSSSKLVFPIKRIESKKRLSEQEAKFLLVKQLEKEEQIKYQYSVETPTKLTYSFTGKEQRSGSIDLCIYENQLPCNLIEFKAFNPKQKFYSKDFEKLLCDDNDLVNYFIQVLENTNSGTISNIINKYKKAVEIVKGKNKPIQSSLKIFICDLKKQNIIKFEIDRKGNLSDSAIYIE